MREDRLGPRRDGLGGNRWGDQQVWISPWRRRVCRGEAPDDVVCARRFTRFPGHPQADRRVGDPERGISALTVNACGKGL